MIRHLGYPSNDPNDLRPLTPNHLLLGRASSCVPQGPFKEGRNPRKRFEFVQSLAHQFWKRFIREYVPTLMRRSKWRTRGRRIKVGDIVPLVDFNTPGGKWNLALVKDVYPGADGVIINVLVKANDSEFSSEVLRYRGIEGRRVSLDHSHLKWSPRRICYKHFYLIKHWLELNIIAS